MQAAHSAATSLFSQHGLLMSPQHKAEICQRLLIEVDFIPSSEGTLAHVISQSVNKFMHIVSTFFGVSLAGLGLHCSVVCTITVRKLFSPT